MKKLVRAFILVLCLINYLNKKIFAFDKINKNEKISFEASYTGDVASNLAGGIKPGICYLGMANLKLNLTPRKPGFWKGTEFCVYASNTHGVSPSSTLYGDLQVASNIDAGNHTYLQEIWIKKSFGQFEYTVGLQDLNVEFANSEFGSLFINSSFGILPIISGNTTPPIFPLTALGLTIKNNVTEKITWVNAIYDGSPTDFDYNPYNIKWQFVSGDGLLAISEFQYHSTKEELQGSYKLGLYSHSHIVEKSLGINIPDSLSFNLLGFYAYIDQNLWKKNNKSIDVFTQIGYSPSAKCTNDFYIGLGINHSGLFSNQTNDVLGIALAYENLKNFKKHETVIELSYQYPLTRNIFFQPDFQYIINPSGSNTKLKNSLAAIFRFGINL